MSIVFEHVAHALRAHLREEAAEVRCSAEGIIVLLQAGRARYEGGWHLAAKLEKMRSAYRLRIGPAYVPRIDPFKGGTYQEAQTFFVLSGREAKIRVQLGRPCPIKLREDQYVDCGVDFSAATEKMWLALQVAVGAG